MITQTTGHWTSSRDIYKGILLQFKLEMSQITIRTKEEVINLIQEMPFHPVGKMVFERYLEKK